MFVKFQFPPSDLLDPDKVADKILVTDGSGGFVVDDLPSGGGVTDVTYAELVALIGASGLVPMAYYKITDFATKHYIAFFDVDLEDWAAITAGDGIITGSAEPLIVQAATTSTLFQQARSTVHLQDELLYDWDPDNWLADIAFATGGDTIISGFKGVITWRHDMINDIEAGFDWRECKFRRWAAELPDAWSDVTEYEACSLVSYDDCIYCATQTSTGETPGANAYWIRIWDVDAVSLGADIVYFLPAPAAKFPFTDIDFVTLTGDSEDYKDFTMLPSAGAHTNIHLAPLPAGFATRLPNVTFCTAGVGSSTGASNIIAKQYIAQVHVALETYSIICNTMINSVFKQVYDTGVAGVTNTIVSESCRRITAPIGIITDSIVYNLRDSTIENRIDTCVIKTLNNMKLVELSICIGASNMRSNVFYNNVSETDFSAATHVAGSYMCFIQNNADGDPVLYYLDGSNTVQYAGITD